ncbi:hypothetical protein [Streptomyces sp. NRRL S-646]|uniref:hypothetical protein n=1 Tax=Streptomyces sp. NRRL S-646 TaxID=1463917 RepID=UPI000B08D58D|nr:hypothetical protein [Streptomyces sp. NRRL S-646]
MAPPWQRIETAVAADGVRALPDTFRPTSSRQARHGGRLSVDRDLVLKGRGPLLVLSYFLPAPARPVG